MRLYVILITMCVVGCASGSYNLTDNISLTTKSQIDYRHDGHHQIIPKYNQLAPMLGTYDSIGINYNF